MKQVQHWSPNSFFPKACDIDEFCRVSPLAVIALVRLLFDLLQLAKWLPIVAVEPATYYVAGLILLGRRASARRIAQYLGGISHDSLTRFREHEEIYPSKFMMGFVLLIQRLGCRGWLIIDDTIFEHQRSTKMPGVYWDGDHALHRHVLGTRMVLLL